VVLGSTPLTVRLYLIFLRKMETSFEFVLSDNMNTGAGSH
jgi:hypothetical protein